MVRLSIADIAVVTADADASRRFYEGGLGLTVSAAHAGNLFFSGLPGINRFGVWTLSEAAETIVGAPRWPADRPTPQVSIEFGVETEGDVAAATAQLTAQGYALLRDVTRQEWGETQAWLQTPEGALVAVKWAAPADPGLEA